MTLRVGHIAYANCIPFFHHLAASGFSGRIVSGVPSELNRLLAIGELDISPSSSFEYGRNWSEYCLFPDLSISSIGAVRSVLLFSHVPLKRLAEKPIAMTGESATSVNLLRILLQEFLGFHDEVSLQTQVSVEESIAAGDNGLLIGDRALRASLSPIAPYVFDLGELWKDFTGLPFVFALWIIGIRASETKNRALAILQKQLRASLERTLCDPARTASEVSGYNWFGERNLAEYWRAVSYDFSPAHREGLELFFRLAEKHRLLPGKPELRFFEEAEII
ncbi:MAG: menaquinone biosynthesis protein [Syntrophotaleaceae bacterium]